MVRVGWSLLFLVGWVCFSGAEEPAPSSTADLAASELAESSAEPTADDAVANPVTLNDAEKAFAERLRGAALIGTFTLLGPEGPVGKPGEERYEIIEIEKVREGRWRFRARIQYMGKDVTLPMVLPVEWAGDTPVISLTNLTIPGLGTFTTRVLFYGDRYAGTWQHDQFGGHMYGRIEKSASTDPPEEKDPNAKSLPEKESG